MQRWVVPLVVLFAAQVIPSNAAVERNKHMRGMEEFKNAAKNITPDVIRAILPELKRISVPWVLTNVLETLKPENGTDCVVDFFAFLFALAKEKFWAFNMLDASGKPAAGILYGNLIWPGNYHTCGEVVQEPPFGRKGDKPFRGKYCWSQLELSQALVPLPSPDAVIPPLKWAMCVPDTCNENDVFKFMKYLLEIKSLYKLANVTESWCIEEQHFWEDTRSVAALFVFLLFVWIVGLATVYDLFLKYRAILSRRLSGEKSSSDGSLIGTENGTEHGQTNFSHAINEVIIEPNQGVLNTDINVETDLNLCQQIILAFSAYRNVYAIFSPEVSKDSINCLYAIRVLAFISLVIIATYIEGALMPDNFMNDINILNSMIFTIFGQASVFASDTFFLMSGILLSYKYFTHYDCNNGKTSWIKFYLYRFLRLTPAYMLFIFLIDDTLANYVTNGPFWPTNGFEGDNCKNNWWWNLLYVNNYLPSKEMCLPQSWYLALDMQFFVLSPVILIMLTIFYPIGLAISGVFILLSWFTSGLISSHYNLEAGLNAIKLEPRTEPYYDVLDKFYYKPYLHIAPFVVGILVGMFLHRSKFQKRIHIGLVCLGWMCSTAAGLALVVGMHNANDYLNVHTSALFHALSRTTWALTVSWVIVACSNGYGGMVNFGLSLPFWRPLSRLTYCAFLLYILVIKIGFYGSDIPSHFTHKYMIFDTISNIAITYLCAVPLSLLFEMPFVQLLKISPKSSNISN